MIQVRGCLVAMGRDMGQAPSSAPSRGSRSGEAACELFDGVLLHRRGDVAVDVHRCGDGGVPQPLLDHFGVSAPFQKLGGVGMAQPLDSDSVNVRVGCCEPVKASAPPGGDRIR